MKKTSAASSRCFSAASASTSISTCRGSGTRHGSLDRLIDAPNVIKAFTSGSIAVDAKQLGALTVSTLRGEDGHQRKEIDKLIEF